MPGQRRSCPVPAPAAAARLIRVPPVVKAIARAPSAYQGRQDQPWPQPATARPGYRQPTSTAAVAVTCAEADGGVRPGRSPGREAAAPVRTERLAWSRPRAPARPRPAAEHDA